MPYQLLRSLKKLLGIFLLYKKNQELPEISVLLKKKIIDVFGAT